MAKTLILHIGDPKTGSALLQEVLFERRFTSPERRIDYPPRLNAAFLANTLRRVGVADQKPAEFAALAEWARASSGEVLVVSADQFGQIAPSEVLAAFQDHLPELVPTLRVIAYTLPHADRFLGTFSQKVKVGQYGLTMESLFDEMDKSGDLTSHARFAGWREVFGDRFTLRPFVAAELRDGDVVADFFGLILGDAPFTVGKEVLANQPLPAEILAGLSVVHRILDRQGLSDGTMHNIGTRMGRLFVDSGKKGTEIGLDRALFKRLNDRCRPDAKAVDQDFFGKPVLASALDQSARAAKSTPPDLSPQSQFKAPILRALRLRAQSLAKEVRAHPGIWTSRFKQEVGRTTAADPNAGLSEAEASHIQTVETLLAQIVDLMTQD